ncbi:MAG: D-alanyl-D-alanine carboxypeptidase [Cellvibrionales bacterium]|nr:D-alanyl-D-alanine carboxypeptidase [Cellvibrionales bacterium]
MLFRLARFKPASATLPNIGRLAALPLALFAQIALAQPLIPAAPKLAAEAWFLMDATTGTVLAEHNADIPLPPASLTKMMTTYIASSEIAAGRLTEQQPVRVSVNAWRKGGSSSGGSTMFLPPEEDALVIDLLRGVIIQSGNDAAIALAEQISGDEDTFAKQMNQQAARLGMRATHFTNATGLPAPAHRSTARDLARLAQAVIADHPKHYALYAEREFKYNGISQPNRNSLLWRDASIDGLKTGHTEEAGYSLVASGERDGMRLISVVLGTRSEQARAAASQKLLAWGFRYYVTHRLYGAEEILARERVWQGRQREVPLGLGRELYLTIPRGAADLLTASIAVPPVLKAPLAAGEQIGTLGIDYQGEQILAEPLVVMTAVPQAGFFGRLWDGLKLFLLRLFG